MGRPSVVTLREGVQVDRHVLRYVEEELRRHRARIKAIEVRKQEIARRRPGGDENIGGGRPQGRPSDPTQSAVLLLLQDEELQGWERRVRAVDAGLALLPTLERQVLDLLYVTRRYQMEGVLQELHIGERTFYRLRNEGLYTLAIAIGIV